MPLIFSYSKVVLHWGFTVRQLGASAAQLAYVLPPPPTVVGAFMNPLARLLGLGERIDAKAGAAGSKAMECALSATLAAAAGLAADSRVGVTVYAEPSRITASTYKTGGDYERAIKEPPYLAIDTLHPVQAVGSASSPSGVLVLAWLVDLDKLSRCLGVAVGLSDLKAAAWGIYRVGSREGLASTVEANVYPHDATKVILKGSVFKSTLYQPEECAKPLQRAEAARVVLYDQTYRERGYLVPSRGGGPAGLAPPVEPVLFEVKSGCRAAHPEGLEEYTISFPVTGGGLS